MDLRIGERKLRIVEGDITKIPADAIVNAANSGLTGGGGVDGAIHKAGGPRLVEDLAKVRARVGRCDPGKMVATTAGDLPAKYVFHTVGPMYREGAEEQSEILASAYKSCLDQAEALGLRIISFPSISTGAFGYPVDLAAPVAVQTVGGHLLRPTGSMTTAIFVLFDQKTHYAYVQALKNWGTVVGVL